MCISNWVKTAIQQMLNDEAAAAFWRVGSWVLLQYPVLVHPIQYFFLTTYTKTQKPLFDDIELEEILNILDIRISIKMISMTHSCIEIYLQIIQKDVY